MSVFNLQVLINLVDRLSGPLQEPIRRLQELERQSNRVTQSMQNMQTGASLMAGGLGLAAPLIFGANEAINFEDKLADVRKVMDELENHQVFQKMGADLRRMSNVIPMTAQDLTEIGAFAAASKLEDTRKGVLRMIEDSAKMGVAFDMSAADSGEALAGLRNIFGLTEDGVVELGDAVNYLGNNTSARARDMVNFLNRAGAVGKQVGLTAMQTAALGNAFLALRTPPEIAARAVTQGLIPSLQTATRQGKKFEEAARSIGLTAQEIQDSMKMDPQGTILDVLERVNKSDNKMLVLTDMFGVGWADDIAKLAGSMDVYYKALGLVSDKTKYAGSMQKEYEGRINTTKTQLKLLWNGITNVGGALGDTFLPYIKQGVLWTNKLGQGIFELTQKHPTLTRMITFGMIAVALLTLAIGGTIFALGMFGFMAANASAGLTLLKMKAADARTYITALRNSLVARITGGWIPSTTAQMQMFGGATTLNQIALQGLRQAFLGAARAAWAFLAPILANPITWVVVAVLALAAAFVVLYQRSEAFRQAVQNGLAPLQVAWRRFLGTVELLKKSFSGLAESVAKALKFDSAQKMFFTFLGWIMFGVGFVLGFIVGLATMVVTKVLDTFSAVFLIFSGLFTWLHGVLTGNSKLIQQGQKQFLDGIHLLWKTLLGNTIQAVVTWVPKIWKAFTDWLPGALKAIKDWSTDLFHAGAHLVSGLIDGVKSKITGAVDAIKGVGNGIMTQFKKALGIQSPSRVFKGFGIHLMEGLSLGIEGTAKKAADATKKAALGVMGAAALTLPVSVAAPATLQAPARVQQSQVLQGSAALQATHPVLQKVSQIPEIPELENPVMDAQGQVKTALEHHELKTVSLQAPAKKEKEEAAQKPADQGLATMNFAGATIIFQMPEGSSQDQLAAFAALLQSLKPAT
ncbi:phage tail tape measure protein [Deinococcus cellulosilyticus]|uniref:Phage tail tape measure protein domain-containing protein n=1 Tax=Deinococcus cellulosilyticus (strain DSM 18568 / NBRC 106333 / KACC 11606 / 5516J-15) TaxID=1223518 RepID=A0A511NB40_DEIC1|nr:phage tail tape measure protein [Deinococcus cellulosilyticus]GEM50030.1 hypothetical protein DC3_56650 [Deinococcus cellulosilyticus NBRC 106333 = KACC 11606]